MSGSASAPGSSGNLGPGFDVLGLALDLRCLVIATPGTEMTADDGEGPQPLADDHIIHGAAMAGGGVPMALVINNAVPRTRGLGSSAAVMVATAAAAARAVGVEPERDWIYEIVTVIEGHGDNVAAAVHGGLTAVCADGPRSLPISDQLVPIVGVPNDRLATSEARDVLPAQVSLATAARSVGRAVALVDGLRTGDRAALAAARGDELHEGPRAVLSPVTGALIDAARDAGALHASWSGAGPSAIALVTADRQDAVVAAMERILGDAGEVMALSVDYDGLV
jgi:homoserine kinase